EAPWARSAFKSKKAIAIHSSVAGEQFAQLLSAHTFDRITPKAFYCSNGTHLLPAQLGDRSCAGSTEFRPTNSWSAIVVGIGIVLLIVCLLHRAIDRFRPVRCSRHSRHEPVRPGLSPIVRRLSWHRSRRVRRKFRVPPNSSPPLSMGRRLW